MLQFIKSTALRVPLCAGFEAHSLMIPVGFMGEKKGVCWDQSF